MKTGDLAKQFGVSNTTIQAWDKRFATFLSIKVGKQRVYDEGDIRVMATIAKLSADGFSLERIEERLAEGYRIEDINAANFGVNTRMIPAAAVEQIIDSTELRVELETVKSERDRLLVIVEKLEQTIEDLTAKLDTIRDEKDEKIERLQVQIVELQRQLGKAEGRLEEIERNRKQEL